MQDTSRDYALSTLVSIDKIPIKFRHIFAQYVYFNRIQSGVFVDVFDADNSIVVSAPTGSGKTVIFELAIVSFLHKKDLSGCDYNFKIIYVAPVKALCEERMVDWHKKFSKVGLNCISVTGDSENVTLESLINHNLIITTPEKWDSLTRRWRTKFGVVGSIPLFLIDEVHLLNDETRGPTMEAIVSRMKTIESEKTNSPRSDSLRFVAVSATISNIEDIADWLSNPTNPAKSFNFSEELRPVKLQKIVKGYHYNPQLSNPFKFDLMLNYKLSLIIEQYCNGKPTLIFCSTRKSVEMTVKHVTQNLTLRLAEQQKQVLQEAAAKINMKAMEGTLVYGVGTHHAGLLPEQRRIIEDLFRNGSLPILVTTSTLAMGVNLPAHLVIIKNTKCYTKCGYQDYTESALLQMIGRAGRPQFDSSATAVILTTTADREKYEKMIGGTQPIESSLHKHLTEHLNAEVVLRTITDLGVAMEWLMSSFLYVRAQKNPKHYGLSPNLTVEQRNQKLIDICQIEINKLAKVGMITMDQSANIVPTNMGALMAKYCIHFETMKLFTKIQGTEILQQVLGIISKCHEYSEMCLRVDDKKALNLLNKCKTGATIRFPLQGKIKTLEMKINCIIQAIFGCLQISDTSLLSEAQRIIRIGERVSKCLAEYLEGREQCFNALYSSLILAKCFQTRIWENSPYVSKQLTGIGIVTSNSLVVAGKTSFKALLDSNPRNLEMIMHRKIPMGSEIQTQIEHIPEYQLVLEEVKVSEKKRKIKVRLDLVNHSKLVSQITVDPQSIMSLIVGDSKNNILLYEKYMHSYMIENPEITKELEDEFTSNTEIQGHFISENWSGIDCSVTLELFPVPKRKKSTKKVTKRATPPAPEVDLNWNKLSHVTSKSCIDHYFKIVKKAAEQKNNSDKESTPSNEAELLQSDNDTGDVESTNQIDEMKLLESSGESGLDAACDAAESFFQDELVEPEQPQETENPETESSEVIVEENIYRDSESKYLEVCNKNVLGDIMQKYKQHRMSQEQGSAMAKTTRKSAMRQQCGVFEDSNYCGFDDSPKKADDQKSATPHGSKMQFRPKSWTTQQSHETKSRSAMSQSTNKSLMCGIFETSNYCEDFNINPEVKKSSVTSQYHPKSWTNQQRQDSEPTTTCPQSSTGVPLQLKQLQEKEASILSTSLQSNHLPANNKSATPLKQMSNQAFTAAKPAGNNQELSRNNYGTKTSATTTVNATNVGTNNGNKFCRFTPSSQPEEYEEYLNYLIDKEEYLSNQSHTPTNLYSKPNSNNFHSERNFETYQGQNSSKKDNSCKPRNSAETDFCMSKNLNPNAYDQNEDSMRKSTAQALYSKYVDPNPCQFKQYDGNTCEQNEVQVRNSVAHALYSKYVDPSAEYKQSTSKQNEFSLQQGQGTRNMPKNGKSGENSLCQNNFSCKGRLDHNTAPAFYNIPQNEDPTFDQNEFLLKQFQETIRNSKGATFNSKNVHPYGNNFEYPSKKVQGSTGHSPAPVFCNKNVEQNMFPIKKVQQNSNYYNTDNSKNVDTFEPDKLSSKHVYESMRKSAFYNKNENVFEQNQFSGRESARCVEMPAIFSQNTSKNVDPALEQISWQQGQDTRSFYGKNMPKTVATSEPYNVPKQYHSNFESHHKFEDHIYQPTNDFSYKRNNVAPTSTIVDPNIPHNIGCESTNLPEQEFSKYGNEQSTRNINKTPRHADNNQSSFSERILAQLSQSTTHKWPKNNESFSLSYSCIEPSRVNSKGLARNESPGFCRSQYNSQYGNVREDQHKSSKHPESPDFTERLQAQMSQVSERDASTEENRKNLKRKLVQQAIRKSFAHGQRKESEYGIVETMCPTSERQDQDGSKKSIKWSSPLVTAGAKYSPKLTNTSQKSQTINPRDTLRRTSRNDLVLKLGSIKKRQAKPQPIRRNLDNVEKFPITDKQCGYTSKPINVVCSISDEDIFSQSLMNLFTSKKHEAKVISQDAASLHKQPAKTKAPNKENVFEDEPEDFFSLSAEEGWPEENQFFEPEDNYFEPCYPDPPMATYHEVDRGMFPRSNSATFAYTQPNVFEVQCYDYQPKFPVTRSFGSQDEYGYPASPFGNLVYQTPYPQFIPENRPMFFNCVDLEEQYRQMEADRVNTIINISHNRNYRPREANSNQRMRRFLSGELCDVNGRKSHPWEGNVNQRGFMKMRNDLGNVNSSRRVLGRLDANH